MIKSDVGDFAEDRIDDVLNESHAANVHCRTVLARYEGKNGESLYFGRIVLLQRITGKKVQRLKAPRIVRCHLDPMEVAP